MPLPAETVRLSEQHRARSARAFAPALLFACVLVLLFCCASAARAAGSLVFCSRPASLSAEQKDRVLVFSQTVREVLEQSGHSLAFISRAGLDLDRFSIRYSHTGISLKHSRNTPWSVRQLYFSCEEGQPRIFDQGLSGFVLDQDPRRPSFISLVFLPEAEAQQLQTAALNDRLSVGLLGAHYSGNAYAFSTRYQNCNQWVMELLAQSWGVPDDGESLRQASQDWLQRQHYQPSDIDVKYRFMVWLSHFVPLVHNDDHPSANLDHKIYQVSMPASIENFVHQHAPGAERVEMCMNQRQIVVHRGWSPIGERCEPAPGDQVVNAF